MVDSLEKPLEKLETIQNIAIKIVEEQLLQLENGPKERTIFILGSKGVGKSTIINKFFDREENSRPTLALEYSFGRRSAQPQSIQKQILNIWELGDLENSNQLIEVPLRSHGLDNLSAIIVLDLSAPNRIWIDLENALQGLKNAYNKLTDATQKSRHQEKSYDRIIKDHPDLDTLEIFPFPLVIVGGKYDIFMDFDPEIKKHVCRCLRSIGHTLGASVVFYSQKISKLSKIMKDTISHFGFGSPSQPFRYVNIDYNGPIAVWMGTDSWNKIGCNPTTIERIGSNYCVEVKQIKNNQHILIPEDPVSDPGFRESAVDEIRSQKDEELKSIIKDNEIRGKFESILF